LAEVLLLVRQQWYKQQSVLGWLAVWAALLEAHRLILEQRLFDLELQRHWPLESV
jgi:hypothetical protein